MPLHQLFVVILTHHLKLNEPEIHTHKYVQFFMLIYNKKCIFMLTRDERRVKNLQQTRAGNVHEL